MQNPAPVRFRELRIPATALLLISGVVNVLALAGALYMLQVYDRVLTSQSVPTLVMLTVAVAGVYIAHGILEAIRGQLLLRIGMRFDEILMPAAYGQIVDRSLKGHSPYEAVQPLRDVDTVRCFLASPGPIAIVDLPWTPVFLAFVTLLSPTLGLLTAGGLAIIVLLAIATDWATRSIDRQAQAASGLRGAEIDATLRNFEPLAAMGMAKEAGERFMQRHLEHASCQRRSGERVIGLSAVSRVARMMLQSAILGTGAYLSLQGDLTIGAIVAASIAAARALVPVEQAIGSWHAVAAARSSFGRLRELDRQPAPAASQVPLPLPHQSIALEHVAVRAPGAVTPIIAPLSMQLVAGQGLAIVGASGAGKSSLARAIAGAWPAAHGTIRFDGAPFDRWPRADRGRFIGYLPQVVELFPGTIAENIARLDDRPDGAAVVAAARAAGIHQTILDLPSGYDTHLDRGAPLSAGQRQQLGLARAIYGDPFVVVLDEPNANLDEAGERALLETIKRIRARGGIAIVIAHRRSILTSLDTIAILDAGRLTKIGPKADVLRSLAERIDDAPLDAKVTALRSAGAYSGVSK